MTSLTQQSPAREPAMGSGSPSPQNDSAAEDFKVLQVQEAAASQRPTIPESEQAEFLYPIYTSRQTLTGIGERWTAEEFGFRRGQFDRDLRRMRPAPNPFAARLNPYWFQAWKIGRMSFYKARTGYSTEVSPSIPNVDWTPLINPMTQSPEYPNGFFDAAFIKSQMVQALMGMGCLIARMLKHETDWNTLVPDIPAPMKKHLHLFPELKTWYEKMSKDAVEVRRGGMPWGYLERCLESPDDPALARCVDRYFESHEHPVRTSSGPDTPPVTASIPIPKLW